MRTWLAVIPEITGASLAADFHRPKAARSYWRRSRWRSAECWSIPFAFILTCLKDPLVDCRGWGSPLMDWLPFLAGLCSLLGKAPVCCNPSGNNPCQPYKCWSKWRPHFQRHRSFVVVGVCWSDLPAIKACVTACGCHISQHLGGTVSFQRVWYTAVLIPVFFLWCAGRHADGSWFLVVLLNLSGWLTNWSTGIPPETRGMTKT